MLKSHHRIVALLIGIIALTALVTPLSAQAHDSGSPTDLLTTLNGLESAYARRYMTASELGFATPDANAEGSLSSLTITVLGFATEEDAISAYQLTASPIVARLVAGVSDVELAASPSHDLGDASAYYEGSTATSETYGLLFVRKGNLGFMITGIGSDAKVLAQIEAIATFMLDREPGEDTVVFSENNPATGSTFDLMPTAADSDVLRGLFPMYDYDLLVSESPATPAP